MLGRTFDRRIARSAVALAALALAFVAVRNDAPLPAPPRDPAAARELISLMQAGERADAIVEYATTRTVPAVAGEFKATVTEVQWGDAHVTRAADTLVIELPDRTYDCQLVEGVAQCAKNAPDRTLPASEVFRIAIGAGAYDVIHLASPRIAGERSRCFRVRPRVAGNELTGIGAQTDMCLAADDGVLLSNRRVARLTTEQQTAQRVVRTVDRDTLRPVLARFDGAFGLLHR